MPRLNAEFVLCQDCLAVESFSDEKHQGKVLCKCGGDFCGCAGCEDDAAEIEHIKAQAEFIDAAKY